MTMDVAVTVILTVTVTASVNANVKVKVKVKLKVKVKVKVKVNLTRFVCCRQLHSTIFRLFKEQILNFLEKAESFPTFQIILPSM